jgi:hypothetical protein
MALCLRPDPLLAQDNGIFIQDAQLIWRSDQPTLSADIQYRLGQELISALEGGIPLTLSITLKLRENRPWWPDATLISELRRIELRYQPLTKVFQIADLESGATQSFATLATVMDTLSRVRGWRLQSAPVLDPQKNYTGSLKMALEVESLPLPLRIQAHISSDWRLKTPNYSWPVKP